MNTRDKIDELKGRILEYLKDPVRGQMSGHLMGEFGLRKGAYLPGGLPESRALDRALQELRKAGRIRYERRQWWLA